MTICGPAGLLRLCLRLAAGTTTAGMAVGCIIPDYDIGTETVRGNPGAVRIVEPTHLPTEFSSRCVEPGGSTLTCSQVPFGRRSGLVAFRDPDTDALLPYCACLEGSADARTVPEFFVYAEDPDRDDVLFAVALLDLGPLTDEPQRFVAYDQQFEPGSSGEEFALEDLDPEQLADADIDPQTQRSTLVASIERDDRLVRFRFGKNGGAGTDLCNDNNGRKLLPGMHTLQVMVTDRPFFRPVRTDANGEALVGADGRPQFDAVQYGMPDLAVGATWSIANYVFECRAQDPEVLSPQSPCACETEAR